MKEVQSLFIFPDDDGRAKRPWIASMKERSTDGCERVREILENRPWIIEEIVEVVKNTDDDSFGIDMYVQIDDRLLDLLQIEGLERGMPIQVKSAQKKCTDFVREHNICKNGHLCFEDDQYTFVLNGLDASEMIMADLLGQMVALVKRKGIRENDLLDFVGDELGDTELVEAYKDHKMILKEIAWYLPR